jgi:hypothetical protein
MSLSHSPSIVTNGLVFYYDMNNTQKSFKGAPTTNLVSPDGNNFANWNSQIAGLTRTSGFLAPDGTMTATKLIEDSANTYHRAGYGISGSAGSARRLSVWASAGERTKLRAWSWAGGDTSQQDFDLVAGTCSGSQSPTITPHPTVTGWYLCSFTVPAANSTSVVIGPSDGTSSTSTYTGVAGYGIYVWNAQLEVGTFSTPYTATSRLSTQTLLDLTGNSTITASTLTYNSDNTFNFNGTTDAMQYTPSGISATGITICAWVYPTDVTGSRAIITNNTCMFQLSSATTVSWWANVAVGQSTITTTVNVNQWQFFAVTQTGTTGNVYRNDALIFSGTTSAYPLSGTNQRQIGMYNGARLFAGKIGALSVYDGVKTGTEILQNFNAHRGRYGI